MSVKDWIQTSKNLGAQLRELAEAAARDRARVDKVRAGFPWLRSSLEKLADYFALTAKDAQGWIGDPEALRVALEALAYREGVARSLAEALETMEGRL